MVGNCRASRVWKGDRDKNSKTNIQHGCWFFLSQSYHSLSNMVSEAILRKTTPKERRERGDGDVDMTEEAWKRFWTNRVIIVKGEQKNEHKRLYTMFVDLCFDSSILLTPLCR